MSRLVLPPDLQTLGLQELWALHSDVEEELARSPEGSAARRNALASLETIRRAIGDRASRPTGPGPGA